MAEIRSTLDIIMEKAKEVDVTEADRIAFKKQELEGKIRGFLQKFQDQIIPEDRVVEELEAIGMQEEKMIREIFMDDCLSRVDPEADNARLLGLMKRATGLDVTPFYEVLKRCRDRMNQERDRCLSITIERLRKRGISGSAVVPNLEADPSWMNVKAKIKQDAMESLMALKP